MIVHFIDKFNPHSAQVHFACYDFDETFRRNPRFIDIKSIIQEKTHSWLEDVYQSHLKLSDQMAQRSFWWWATPMSRFDARPWGQEYIFKPLFFARALSEWIQTHPDQAQEIDVVGAHGLVATYLREFEPALQIQGEFSRTGPIPFFYLKSLLKSLAKLGSRAWFVLTRHLLVKRPIPYSRNVVISENVAGASAAEGHRYFFGGIFDGLEDFDISFASIMDYGCEPKPQRSSQGSGQPPRAFYWLDQICFTDWGRCIIISLKILWHSTQVARDAVPCYIGGKTSRAFHHHFLLHELGRLPFFIALCSYYAARRYFSKVPNAKVIFPYEEKGLERCVLRACAEFKVFSIGYLPHPQHHLLRSLKDSVSSCLAPKPSQYAACGHLYIEYLEKFAFKNPSQIHVWGSSKSEILDLGRDSFGQRMLSIGLLNSHPNELKVFRSWIENHPELTQDVRYSIRLYKGVYSKELLDVCQDLTSRFPNIIESHESWDDFISRIDIAVFCATSAGLIAVNKGCLAVHLFLDDFFDINPCFDKLEVMLSCKTSEDFTKRLEQLKRLSKEEYFALHEKQKGLVQSIFSPVRKDVIRKDLG
ncbi:MAG: hypothetical protein NUV91_00610 [Candidatus Omnitrophica bacterium]|nr:hypothetical protein [Candidatus Omnitrophota bacterium]